MTARAEAQGEQLVVLQLGGESYGVDIAAVNSIVTREQITRVPHAPAFVEGVINLRGAIVPVVDLRRRFGLPAAEPTVASRIVVVETRTGLLGLLVDAVTETISVRREAVEPPSSLLTTSDSPYLRGVARLEDRLIVILDLEQILPRVETASLASAAAQAGAEEGRA